MQFLGSVLGAEPAVRGLTTRHASHVRYKFFRKAPCPTENGLELFSPAWCPSHWLGATSPPLFWRGARPGAGRAARDRRGASEFGAARMVLCCLVDPLVDPQVKRGPDSVGLSPLGPAGRRLAATALAATALALVTTAADTWAAAPSLQSEPMHTVGSAHLRPDPTPRPRPVQATTRPGAGSPVTGLRASPRFEWDALRTHRLRHQRDLERDQRPGLGLGRRLDRLISSQDETFLRFGSGTHRTGFPVSD